MTGYLAPSRPCPAIRYGLPCTLPLGHLGEHEADQCPDTLGVIRCQLFAGHGTDHRNDTTGQFWTRPAPWPQQPSCANVLIGSPLTCTLPDGHYPDSDHKALGGPDDTAYYWRTDGFATNDPAHDPCAREPDEWLVIVTTIGTQDRDHYRVAGERPARALATSVRTELERLGRNGFTFHVGVARLQPGTLRAIVDDQWGRG